MNPIEALLRRKPTVKPRSASVLDQACAVDDAVSMGRDFIVKVDQDHIDVYDDSGKVGGYSFGQSTRITCYGASDEHPHLIFIGLELSSGGGGQIVLFKAGIDKENAIRIKYMFKTVHDSTLNNFCQFFQFELEFSLQRN